MKKVKPKLLRILLYIFFSLAIVLSAIILIVHWVWFRPNVSIPGQSEASLYIRTNSTFDQVKTSLYSQGFIHDHRTFEWLAGKNSLKKTFLFECLPLHPGTPRL